MNTQNYSRPDVYRTKAITTRRRNARIDAKLTAEFAARAIALQEKLDTITSANKAKMEQELNEWESAVTDEMEVIPTNPADLFTPWQVGRIDFEEGRDSDPCAHYSNMSDINAYERGYDTAEREAKDTEDYESDIEDREFWSRGQW